MQGVVARHGNGATTEAGAEPPSTAPARTAERTLEPHLLERRRSFKATPLRHDDPRRQKLAALVNIRKRTSISNGSYFAQPACLQSHAISIVSPASLQYSEQYFSIVMHLHIG